MRFASRAVANCDCSFDTAESYGLYDSRMTTDPNSALSVLLYLALVHPTVVAERFIRSVETHEFRQLDPICPLSKEGWLTDWILEPAASTIAT